MKFEYLHPADQLIMIMQRIYEKGLTTTSGGNLSIMDNDGNLWITPAGIDKGTLTRRDIVCVRPDGTQEGIHRPSSELPFHQSVYRRRPDIKAVLHAHPPALVAFSIARKLPQLNLQTTVQKVCRQASMSKYAVPGSDELGENIAQEFDKGIDIVFLENHGVCIGAKNLFQAFMKFETIEYGADLEIAANRLGKVHPIPESDLNYTVTRAHELMDDFIPKSHSAEECAARRDMITLIHRSYRQNLFTATHGSYSVRLSDGSFIITPFGHDRAYLEEGDLVRIKAGMKEQGKLPSRAVMFHQKVYDNNPDINAVLVAQPLHVMAFAVTDAVFDPRTIPESYILLRDIQKESYEMLYKDQDAASRLFKPSVPAILFENDCIVCTGGSLLQAFDRMEVAEATAHSIIESRDIGPIVHITDREVDDIKAAFHLED